MSRLSFCTHQEMDFRQSTRLIINADFGTSSKTQCLVVNEFACFTSFTYLKNFYRTVFYADSEKVDFIFDKYFWKKIKKYMGSHFYLKKLGSVRTDLVFILLHYP